MNLFLSNVLVTCATKLCSTNSWAGRRFKPLTQITHFTVTGLLSVYYEINTNTNKWVTARSLLYVILPNTFWHCHHRPEVVWLHWHVYAWDWVSKNLLSVSVLVITFTKCQHFPVYMTSQAVLQNHPNEWSTLIEETSWRFHKSADTFID